MATTTTRETITTMHRSDQSLLFRFVRGALFLWFVLDDWYLPSMLSMLSTTTPSSMMIGIQAYPTGAGGCTGGMAAVGPPHKAAAGLSGSLEDGDYLVGVNNNLRLVANQTVVVDATTNHDIAVSGEFRGILIRMTGANVAIVAGENTAEALQCTAIQVEGVTHFNNSDKTIASGTFITDDAGGNITVDITVVRNFSTYYYSQYTIQAISNQGTKAPSSAPPPSGGTSAAFVKIPSLFWSISMILAHYVVLVHYGW